MTLVNVNYGNGDHLGLVVCGGVPFALGRYCGVGGPGERGVTTRQESKAEE